jgi:hypothetical protein
MNLLNCDEIDANCIGKLYPDGQLIKLFFYLNLLSGSKGQYFYNAPRLSGSYSKEKRLTIEQILHETVILRKYIHDLQNAEFFDSIGNIFGSRLTYKSHSITSYFQDDPYLVAHPSTSTSTVKLINSAEYYYDLFCWRKLDDENQVTTKLPLITIDRKPDIDDICDQGQKTPMLFSVLKNRVKQLYKNVQPSFELAAQTDIKSYYAQLDKINEFKRNTWLNKHWFNYNGDIINTLYWTLKRNQKIEVHRSLFEILVPYLNFYTSKIHMPDNILEKPNSE